MHRCPVLHNLPAVLQKRSRLLKKESTQYSLGPLPNVAEKQKLATTTRLRGTSIRIEYNYMKTDWFLTLRTARVWPCQMSWSVNVATQANVLAQSPFADCLPHRGSTIRRTSTTPVASALWRTSRVISPMESLSKASKSSSISRAVAGFGVAAASAPVREIDEDLDAFDNDSMGLMTLDVRHKADATGFVLVRRIVEPLCGRQSANGDCASTFACVATLTLQLI